MYGGAHLLAALFVWSIVLSLAAEGYSAQLREANTLALFGASILAVVLPLLSAYALLRGRRWAGGMVLVMCLVILTIGLAVVVQISRQELSTNRLVFVILYGGASLALCLYGLWFARMKERK